MAGWDGSGNFVRTDGTRTGTTVWQDAKAAGVKIEDDDHDTHDQAIADGLENTVALDGQNTTTTDNAILRYDSGNTAFEGVAISASQFVGRGSSGDVKGINVASARALLGVGSATPTNNQTLFYASASGKYEQKSSATARSILGLGTAAPSNDKILQWSSSKSSFEQVGGFPNVTSAVTSNTGELNKLDGLTHAATAAGYVDLPGGIIIQWVDSTSGTGSGSVNWPKEFPTNIFQASITGDLNSTDTVTAHIKTLSTTSCSFFREKNGSSSSLKVRIIGIGN